MPTYSSTAIDDRLLGTVAAIDSGGANGNLRLLTTGGAVVSTFELAAGPCGTVANNVLTLGGTLLDPSAIGGSPTAARIENSVGDIIVSGLTAGMSSAGPHDITLSSSTIKPGDVVEILSAQIIGAP